ncbi:hypothetical protein P22_2194 [Propionispora sp. 2/2-37]|uniref:MinD/ParA family protein n=1 Tax=Propionispora sp. 2/2-37 TaxID=1677858 RepID=UPI0006BB6AB6|nr:MinD/ParA family protein [Propionispora sp. 2/2-37]CUH96106.1 hypothetical protein P22_2194 [Propionispora sp. 2/2-37]
MRDQAERLRQIVQQNRYAAGTLKYSGMKSSTRVIAITSGKGGVGKTNFSVNLALALSNLGQKILVLDADLGMANVDVLFGCPATYNLFNLVEDQIGIEDITVDGPRGIKFLSGGSGIYDLANLSQTQLQHIISQLSLLDHWADIILVDTGAGINRNVVEFVLAADEVIIITTPEPTAITDAYAMMKVAGQQGCSALKLIINRVVDRQEGMDAVDNLIHAARRFLQLQVEHLGFIYEDINMRKAVRQQTPLLLAYPESVSSCCIEGIARKLLYHGEISHTKGLRGFLSRFFHII